MLTRNEDPFIDRDVPEVQLPIIPFTNTLDHEDAEEIVQRLKLNLHQRLMHQ
jgi:hypothetical protein